ncbi:T9SS type A sorting domain-containing protein [Candidatus Neomarinimicrobiota bacterium]
MKKRLTIRCIAAALILFASASVVNAQGDNAMDPDSNLALIVGATLSGSVPEGTGRGILTDILWDPATSDWASPSSWHEYGLKYDSTAGGVTPANPFYWQVEWSTAKNINYITATGPFGNQPQPTTGWAIQIDSAGSWKNIVKNDDGWHADTLKGVAGWVDDGLLELRLAEPVVTTKLRFIAYANPDSLADGIVSSADSLWSFVIVGRSGDVPSCLIQYIDHSAVTAATNPYMDSDINLALLYEAVVSVSWQKGDNTFGLGTAVNPSTRGEPTDLLFDPVKGDFHVTDTPWGEIGWPYQYIGGFVTEADPWYWQVEWVTPKNVNLFTWGGVYGNQPQPDTPWKVEAEIDGNWEVLASGIGTEDGMGVDSDAESVLLLETPIVTKKFRIATWSDGIVPLESFHLRGRGGTTTNWTEVDTMLKDISGADSVMTNNFKSILLQYADFVPFAIEDGLAPAAPVKFTLTQNYPNPFNPITNIGFELDRASHVRLTIYDLLGKEVAVLVDGVREVGQHNAMFDAAATLSSGVYFYQISLDHGAQVATKKMLFLK